MICVSDLIGVPYTEHGRTIEEGFDCYGLVMEVARRYGKELPDFEYGKNFAYLADEYAPLLPLAVTDTADEGVVLEIIRGDFLHIGICLDSKRFIHCTMNQGVRISLISDWNVKRMYKWV